MRVALFSGVLACLCLTVSANAAVFRTTLDFAPETVDGVTYDRVVFDFETDATAGVISAADLTNWTIQLFNGLSLEYTDNVVVGSVFQPINGFSRVANSTNGGAFFDFDLGSLMLLFFDNYFSSTTGFGPDQGANGDINVFNNFSGDPLLNINTGAVNSAVQADQSTMELSPVPLPAAFPLFILGLGGIWAAARRRLAA